MKKKIFLISLIICLAFVSPGLANAPVTVIVNGSYLNSDVPPQIINGRVMVPLRAVSESLGCIVEWNSSLNQVNITSQTTPITDLTITAPDEFKIIIVKSLNKMDPYTRLFVPRYIKQIVFENPPHTMDPTAKAEMFSNGICYINGTYFNEAQKKFDEQDLIYGYLGYLVHEATHACLAASGQDFIYSTNDKEVICQITAIRAMDNAGCSSNNPFHKAFLDSLKSKLNY